MINPLYFLLLLTFRFTIQDKEGVCVVVVEYQTVPGLHSNPANNNADIYLKIISEVTAQYNVGVIIFPEATLDNVGTKKDLEKRAVVIERALNPCIMPSLFPLFLQRLSCAARYHHLAIVFNLIEESEHRQYSSDIILNSQGTIEYSLRKEHRIGVSALEHKPIPFAIPARYFFKIWANPTRFEAQLKFTATSVVTGFSFSWEKVVALDNRIYVVCSNWISQLPFLTSLQVYQMWADEFDILLFVSGANNPGKGQGGTAIFHGDAGPVLLDIEAAGGTKVFVYELSSKIRSGFVVTKLVNKTFAQEAGAMDRFYLEEDPDLYRYESVILNPKQPTKHVELCYNKTEGNLFCCNFFYNVSIDSSFTSKKKYSYHMVAYRGYKTYYNIFEPGGVEVCAIVACLNSDISSCGQRFDNYDDVGWDITFEKIVITATFGPPIKQKIYYSSQFPNSLLSTIKPIHPNYTVWKGELVIDSKNNTFVKRTFELVQRQSQILTFGIFGRNFTLHDSRNSGYNLCGKQNIFYLAVGLSVLRL